MDGASACSDHALVPVSTTDSQVSTQDAIADGVSHWRKANNLTSFASAAQLGQLLRTPDFWQHWKERGRSVGDFSTRLTQLEAYRVGALDAL